jgi:hypothetical protein
MSLRLAKMKEVPQICREFRNLEKQLKAKGQPPIFSFVRQDYLERCVKAGILYFDHDVIGVVKQYKVNQKHGIRKGDWYIPEILNTKPNNVMGTFAFVRTVLEEKVKDARLYGTIRDDNTMSVKFFTTFGYKRVADLSWSKGTIPGGLYVYDNAPELPSKFFKAA